MAKRTKPKSPSVKVSSETFTEIARQVVGSHDSLLADGWLLKPASRIWRRKDGTWSGRFLYHKPDGGSVRVSIEHKVQWVESA